MIYCPEFIVSYIFVLFYFVLISLLNSQLIFLMLVLSSSRVHGRLFREIIDANRAKEITTKDNSFSKFLGTKEVVNDAFEELSERGEMDKEKRKNRLRQFQFFMSNGNGLNKTGKKKICESDDRCRCRPVDECSLCICSEEC